MQIMYLDRQEVSRREIAQRMGVARKTVARYLAQGGAIQSHPSFDLQLLEEEHMLDQSHVLPQVS